VRFRCPIGRQPYQSDFKFRDQFIHRVQAIPCESAHSCSMFSSWGLDNEHGESEKRTKILVASQRTGNPTAATSINQHAWRKTLATYSPMRADGSILQQSPIVSLSGKSCEIEIRTNRAGERTYTLNTLLRRAMLSNSPYIASSSSKTCIGSVIGCQR
jgi:hypothetical protein